MQTPNVRLYIFFLGLVAAAAIATAAVDTPAAAPVTAPAAGGAATPPAAVTPAIPAPAAVSTTNGGSVPLQVTPAASKEVTLNLARWYTGASLLDMSPAGQIISYTFADRDNTPYSPLLEEDSTAGVPFKAGTTRLMLDLGPQPTTLKTFGFYSFSAAGTAELFYATGNVALRPTNSAWKPANVKKDFKANEVVHADILADARFVMITVNLTTPGEIGALEMFGTRVVKDTVAPKQTDQKNKDTTDEDTIDFDYALQGFGAKVTQVDGGNATQANNVLDTNLKTSFSLGDHSKEIAAAGGNTSNITANTDVDLNNILVVDMGQQRTINKVALLFKTTGSGNFDFYLLDDLPVNPDANGALKPPPAAPPATTEPAPAAAAPAAANFPPSATPAFFASHSSSMLRALFFAQIGADATPGQPTTIDYLPKNFFQDYKPNYTQGVAADSERVSHDLTKLPCRFCLIRWVPTNPNQAPLQVYKVNLIGKVPVQNFVTGSKENAVIGGLAVPGIGSPAPVNTVTLTPTTQQGGRGAPPKTQTNVGGDPTPPTDPTAPTPPPPEPTNPLPTSTPTPVTPTPDTSPPVSA